MRTPDRSEHVLPTFMVEGVYVSKTDAAMRRAAEVMEAAMGR